MKAGLWDYVLLSTEVVAPLVGAWIESCKNPEQWHIELVAPLVGAWIEREYIWTDYRGSERRSSCRSVD